MANSKESSLRLVKAIMFKDLSDVKELVEGGVNCHAVLDYSLFTHIYGSTFLHVAVHVDKPDIVKYLIEEKGVDVDQFSEGKTPLHRAAGCGYYECVKLLVKNGADCNAADDVGLSPCHYAAAWGHTEIIEFLVKHGKADINKRAELGITPFHIAAGQDNNDSSFLKFLINLGADFNARDLEGHSALHNAGTNGCVSTVKFLIEEKLLDPNKCGKKGESLLHCVLVSEKKSESVKQDHAKIVEYLVKEGKVNLNKVMDMGLTPLHVACMRRDLNIVKLLVEGGADCKAGENEGNSSLHLSVHVGKVDIAKYLIEKTNVDVNERNLNGETPLHFACQSGKLDSVKLLLDNGADINSVDNLGRYCFHFATIKDKAEIVKYLAEERKFDVNRGMEMGRTSLHLAASCGHLGLCKLLVELGADYALTDMKGNSALHYAAKEGYVNIVEYFIKEVGQDANKCINKLGASPLHLACEKDHLVCVKFLVKNGADYKLLDKKGRSCLDLAAKASDLEVFRCLVRENNLHGDVYVRNTFGTTPLERMMMFQDLAVNPHDCHIS